MRETIGEACPAVDFGEQFGDAQTRQHRGEPTDKPVRGLVFALANGTDRQALLGERGLGQLAGGGESVDFAKACFQPLGFLVAPVLEMVGNGEAQFAGFSAVLECVARQEEVVEGAESAAAFDPNVARLQPLAQRHHDRDLISPAIGSGVGLDELAPCRTQKTRGRARRKFLRAARVKLAHHVERREERVVVFPRPEDESAEDNRRHAAHTRIALDDLAEIVGSSFSSVTTGLRPPWRPRTAAASRPARVRSRMRSRPNCPSAPKIWKTSLPPGVVVSIASVSERKLTPRASRAFTVSIRCGNDRPRRSSFHTVRISPWRAKLSAAANPGRSALAPDALSSKMRAQPALARASSCSAKS